MITLDHHTDVTYLDLIFDDKLNDVRCISKSCTANDLCNKIILDFNAG